MHALRKHAETEKARMKAYGIAAGFARMKIATATFSRKIAEETAANLELALKSASMAQQEAEKRAAVSIIAQDRLRIVQNSNTQAERDYEKTKIAIDIAEQRLVAYRAKREKLEDVYKFHVAALAELRKKNSRMTIKLREIEFALSETSKEFGETRGKIRRAMAKLEAEQAKRGAIPASVLIKEAAETAREDANKRLLVAKAQVREAQANIQTKKMIAGEEAIHAKNFMRKAIKATEAADAAHMKWQKTRKTAETFIAEQNKHAEEATEKMRKLFSDVSDAKSAADRAELKLIKTLAKHQVKSFAEGLKSTDKKASDKLAPPAKDTVREISTDDLGTSSVLNAGLNAYETRNYTQALNHWLPVAKLSNAEAQFYVGGLYRDGTGVATDLPQAYLWWSLAAQSGHRLAKRFLQDLHSEMQPHELVQARRLVNAANSAN
jgi:TPR repeat protein